MKRLIAAASAAVIIAAFAAVTGIFAKSDILGDANGDGKLDNKDVVTLFRNVSGNKEGAAEENCDFNQDGETDNKDVVALFRALSSGAISATGSSEETEDPEISNNETWDKSPSIFYKLEDFKYYVYTNDQDLSKYSIQPWYLPTFVTTKDEVLFVDEIFPDSDALMSTLKEIYFFDNRQCSYYFNSGITITISNVKYENSDAYDEKIDEMKNKSENYRYITLSDAMAEKRKANEDTHDIVHIINDTCLTYKTKYDSNGDFFAFQLRIFLNNYVICIDIDPYILRSDATYSDVISYPANETISYLFEENNNRNIMVLNILSSIIRTK